MNDKKNGKNSSKKDKPVSATRKKWMREEKALKAVQLAFDVAEEVQHQVRREALDAGISPSDRIREILGLPVASRRVRPRLTISLSADDFTQLADHFEIDAEDKLAIKQKAAELLVTHVRQNNKKT